MSRRRRRAGLNPRLTDARTPIFLLDHRRQVVLFNSGCEELTGWKAGEVVGRVCDYATDPASAGRASSPSAVDDVLDLPHHGQPETDERVALTGSLCPPPEVFLGRSQSVPVFLPRRDGRALGRQLHFYPLTDADGRVESVLGLVTPLEEPRPRVEPTPAQRLHAELASLRVALRQRFSLTSIVGAGEAMHRVLAQINLARQTRTPLAIEGEPGTGKEHVARVIHYAGPESRRAFVPLDCRRTAAIDLKLTLRRLLGAADEAERADAERADADERSPMTGLQPGTLYLSDVECLPRDLQEFVVRVFAPAAAAGGQRDSETSPSRGAGSRPPSPGPAPLRLIVATSAKLDALLADETLRPDFYYLVTPLRIAVPPLRDRPDDLPLLAQSLLESLNRGAEVQLGGFTEAVWAKFHEYHWPGNLDELEAVIAEARSAAIQTDERTLIAPDDLPFRFRTGLDAQSLGPRVEPRAMPLEPFLEQIEREHIVAALEQARHSRKKAADLLGMTRPRLYRRMEALGIEDREPPGPANNQ
ncbi:MAG TPA: sigma 54-interacting transcriptional regulator [Planctomycetaceae bacterium]|nr:sigma 54-interacting transcriptional regulator [Planctomycetaceae bacterium]